RVRAVSKPAPPAVRTAFASALSAALGKASIIPPWGYIPPAKAGFTLDARMRGYMGLVESQFSSKSGGYPQEAIGIRGVVKRYGSFEALKGVSLSIADNEFFTLLG